eukprot:COSAG06_NODE_53782_length_298_cov_0.713568_1_plen_62_part_01
MAHKWRFLTFFSTTSTSSYTPYLESITGWEGFAVDDESKGAGDRNEYHRRRMAYFLRFVNEC